jgi:hypothetical protein
LVLYHALQPLKLQPKLALFKSDLSYTCQLSWK